MRRRNSSLAARKSMTIEIELQDAWGGEAIPAAGEFEKWLTAALQGRDDVSLAVRVVGESEMQALNARYRGQDKPTNVLSFPAELPPALEGHIEPEPLGDIVICGPVVEAEARRQGKTVLHHWAHLCVHGLLHLRGHDHQEDEQARAMEAREVSILSGFGIPDPYNR